MDKAKFRKILRAYVSGRSDDTALPINGMYDCPGSAILNDLVIRKVLDLEDDLKYLTFPIQCGDIITIDNEFTDYIDGHAPRECYIHPDRFIVNLHSPVEWEHMTVGDVREALDYVEANDPVEETYLP